MYTLIIALAIAALAIPAVLAFGLDWYTGLAPAALIFPVVSFVLYRQYSQKVQEELASLPALLHDRKIDEARTKMETVRATWGPWVPLLHGQLTNQIGMLAFMQLKFDEALPLLEAGWYRDWMSQVAAATIYFRRDELDACWEAFEGAAQTSAKEAHLYAVHAILATRKGERDRALRALAAGLEQLPDHQLLRQMKNKVANKQRLDPAVLGETWWRFFPDEMVQQMQVKGRRGGLPFELPQGMVGVRHGPPQPKMRGKLGRRR